MIILENYTQQIKLFISESIDNFAAINGQPKCMIIKWDIDRSCLISSFSKNQFIEHIVRDKQEPQFRDFTRLELNEWSTYDLNNETNFSYKEETFNWGEQPYKENLDNFIRNFINDILSISYDRNCGIEIFIETKYCDDWNYRKLVFTSRQNQLGRFIVSKLRDSPLDLLNGIEDLKTFKNNDKNRFVKLFQELNDSQKEDIRELVLDLVDYSVFEFLCGVDESFSDYEGIKIIVGQKELIWKDFLGGGYKEEYFLWREYFSKYHNNN